MSRPSARAVALAVLAATVAQLAVGAFASLERFEGKGFAARLIGYPVLMLLLPLGWALVARVRKRTSPTPWAATALVMAPFLVDVTGNSFDLYDTVGWWDDANHLANWLLLSLGLGLALERAAVRPRWVLGVAVAGLGAALAIVWELGEWYTFIRHGTELGTAYEDTLGDQALGTAGAVMAAYVVAALRPLPSWRAGRLRWSVATAGVVLVVVGSVIAVRAAEPPAVPFRPLPSSLRPGELPAPMDGIVATLEVPDRLPAAAVVRLRVTLRNRGVDAVKLEPCPSYRIVIGVDGTVTEAEHALNCAESPDELRPGDSVTFELHGHTPTVSSVEVQVRVSWRLLVERGAFDSVPTRLTPVQEA